MNTVKYRVLVVEDEPIILRHTMRKVDSLSMEIRVVAGVESAEEALEIMDHQIVEILLTDIEMGDMNGLALIREAKFRCPQLATIILSGYDNFKYVQTAIRYGADDYLLKPIDTEQLKEVFARVTKKIHDQNSGGVPSSTENPRLSLAEEIEKELRKQYNQPVAMTDLSAWFNYAPSYISRVFKKKYQTSPIQYQRDLRIEKAKKILANQTETNVQAVAIEVGYDDARYFSRVFSQVTGCPPSEWKESTK